MDDEEKKVYVLVYEDPYREDDLYEVVGVSSSRAALEAEKERLQKKVFSVNWQMVSGYEIQTVPWIGGVNDA